MIRVSSVEAAPFQRKDAGWVYLGKDPEARARVEKLLGRPPEPLGAALRAEALRLRGPFLDLVAGMARAGDPMSERSWWAGTLAWKAWGASDLFLLCCYQSLLHRWLDEPAPLGKKELVAVVEDPWLLNALAEGLPCRDGVCVPAAPKLDGERARLFAMGTLRRAKWLGRTLLSKLSLALRRAGTPDLSGRLAFVYSHLMPRSLGEGGRWTDHYLTGLEEELRAGGYKVARFVDSDVTGFEGALAARGGLVVPTLRWATWKGVLASAYAAPPPPERGVLLEGRPLGFLLEREWWHDWSRSGRCAYLLFSQACRRLFRASPPALLVFPWENQPQERMMILAAREAGARCVGHQHTTVPRLQLPLFLGAGEAERAPLPDLLVCAGQESLERLAEGGWPRERLVLGGSRRYSQPPKLPAPEKPRDVLLVLPIDPNQSRELLGAAARAFPNGGEGFSFVIQPHPAEPLSAADLPFPAELSSAPIASALARCGRVVACASTAGLEALAAGRAVLRFRCDAQLDLDPLEDLGDERLPTAGPHDFGDKLRGLEASGELAQAARGLFGRLFSPLDKQAWRAAVEAKG